MVTGFVEKSFGSYAEGVAQHSPGSRERTLGKDIRFRVFCPEGVAQGIDALCATPFGVEQPRGILVSQGALAATLGYVV